MGLVDNAKTAKVTAPGTAVVQGAAGSSITLDLNAPLPSTLAQNNAVKAMLLTAQESVLHARVQGYWNQLPDPRISLGDFKDLITGINSTTLLPYRETGVSASGAAGAAAEGTSGIIVRALGGANLGLTFGIGALGKISVGDNNLLTQMVDTWTESTGQRSTEIFASELLYGVSLPNATSEFCDH